MQLNENFFKSSVVKSLLKRKNGGNCLILLIAILLIWEKKGYKAKFLNDFNKPFTIQFFSDFTNLTRDVVSNAFKVLKEEFLLELTKKGEIIIFNQKALRKICLKEVSNKKKTKTPPISSIKEETTQENIQIAKSIERMRQLSKNIINLKDNLNDKNNNNLDSKDSIILKRDKKTIKPKGYIYTNMEFDSEKEAEAWEKYWDSLYAFYEQKAKKKM